jgi:hypothetical protein
MAKVAACPTPRQHLSNRNEIITVPGEEFKRKADPGFRATAPVSELFLSVMEKGFSLAGI